MRLEQKLRSMGLPLQDLEEIYRNHPSGARLISHYAVQNLLFLAGAVPIKDGRAYLPGVLGKDLTIEQGYEAARYAALMSLSLMKYALEDLDRVDQIVRMEAFVNSAPGFTDQPRVANGAVDLFVDLYGEKGKPTRAAIGCQGLSKNHSVELVLTVLFSGAGTRPPLARDLIGR